MRHPHAGRVRWLSRRPADAKEAAQPESVRESPGCMAEAEAAIAAGYGASPADGLGQLIVCHGADHGPVEPIGSLQQSQRIEAQDVPLVFFRDLGIGHHPDPE